MRIQYSIRFDASTIRKPCDDDFWYIGNDVMMEI